MEIHAILSVSYLVLPLIQQTMGFFVDKSHRGSSSAIRPQSFVSSAYLRLSSKELCNSQFPIFEVSDAQFS